MIKVPSNEQARPESIVAKIFSVTSWTTAYYACILDEMLISLYPENQSYPYYLPGSGNFYQCWWKIPKYHNRTLSCGKHLAAMGHRTKLYNYKTL